MAVTLQVKKKRKLQFCQLLSMFILIAHSEIREIIRIGGPSWVHCEIDIGWNSICCVTFHAPPLIGNVREGDDGALGSWMLVSI